MKKRKMKKLFSWIMLAMLSGSMLLLVIDVQPVKSQPEKLASGNEIWTFAIDSEYLYFTELADGRIRKVAKTGGPVATLATGIQRVTEITCDSEYVYYADEYSGYDGKVIRIQKNGENPTILASGLIWIFFIAQDTDHIYFAEGQRPSSPGSVKKVPKAGGPIMTLATGISETGGLVADSEYVYFVSNRITASRINRVNKDGANLVTLASGLGTHVDWLAVDDEYVYFAEYTPYQQGASRVGRVPKAGGLVQILADAQNNLWGLDTDSNFAYFSESGAGNIKRVPKNGGTIETLATGYPGTGQLIVESNCVYYSVANWGQPHVFNGVYRLQLTIRAIVDIDPNTLNLKSNGEWITCYIELPVSFDVGDIVVNTILLNGTIGIDLESPTQIGDYDCDGIADLMVKFDRSTVIDWLRLADYSQDTGKSFEVNMKITGMVTGTPFEGADTVKVLFK